MLIEPNLEQVEEVTAKNVSADRAGTEPDSQIKSSELTVRYYDRQDPCIE
jgi:hypothetical protein